MSQDQKEILEDVDNFIKSRSANALGVVGKAAMFDTKSHSNTDYTAGGRLCTRWVNNDSTQLAKRRQQGFVLPSEVSPRFKDLSMKNQVLMLIPKETRAKLTGQVDQITDRFEGAVFDKDIKGRAQAKGLEQFSVTTPDGAPLTPTNAIVPGPNAPKRPIGAK